MHIITAVLMAWPFYALVTVILFREFILGPDLLLGTDTQALSITINAVSPGRNDSTGSATALSNGTFAASSSYALASPNARQVAIHSPGRRPLPVRLG